MPKPFRLRLNEMQFFSEGGDNPPATPEGGDPIVTDPNPTPPATDSNPEPPVTFTQEQVEEAKQKQEAALLKKLGVENFEQLKQTVTGWNEHQESLKTEQDKINEQLTTYQTQAKESENTIFSLQAENVAIKAGIKEDSINDVITLAKTNVSDDVDIAKAIEMVVEKHPYFKGVVEAPPADSGKPKPTFSNGQHQQQSMTESEKWAAAFDIQKQ
jgi:hypothetical protein